MIRFRMSTTVGSFSAGCLLALFLATTASAAPVIDNGDKPANGRRIQQTEEMWRIGGIDDEENLLGLIQNVVADEQGNLYMLDTQLIEVLVYGPDGQYLKSLGNEGDGPGELRRPRGVVLLPDGTVGLMQGFPGRIVKVDRDGLPAGELRPGGDPVDGGFFALRKAVAAGSHLVMSGASITRDDEKRTARNFVMSYDAVGAGRTEYFHMTNIREMASDRRDETSGFFPDSWALSQDGRVWIPPFRNDYHIDVYEADGTLQRTITRKYESYRRSDLEMEQRRTSMTPRGGRNRRTWNVVVEPTMRDIMQMHVDNEDRLWVLTSRGAHPDEPGIHSVWDVFDAEGRFDQEVAVACEGVAIQDGIILPGHGMVVVVKQLMDAALAFRGQAPDDGEGDTEAVPLEVICYRMTP